MLVYKAHNKLTGEFYIGKTKRNFKQRMQEHTNTDFTHAARFKKALYKYGWNNFKWSVLKECQTVEELHKTEIELIKKYSGKKMYNVQHNSYRESTDKTTIMGKCLKLFKRKR